ncbi:MAG: UDP-N-acetylmuramoyl-tripeptide--D-alanyl-D-alanine ligase [Spirochaetia bacterium]|nr:UDP-N-acetylmuramoyl-tripeptide--D-alanyl-D-alanine ligase [Spirochaetia bacterium]
MRVWKSDELNRVLGLPVQGKPQNASGVSTDTRTLAPGNIFVCLIGDNFDGHEYATTACQKGATGIIANRMQGELLKEAIPPEINLYLVEDTLTALLKLGAHARDSLSCPVLGVAGSNGKTSTKDMLAGMGRQIFKRSYATRGNLNNHIGLPLTLANIPEDAEIVILEMGMNHAGELAELSKIARPHHSIVTSIALEHAEFFSSIEEIARAELEITEGMSGGTLLYHAGSPCQEIAVQTAKNRKLTLEQYQAEGSVRLDAAGISFGFKGQLVNNPNYFSRVMAENLYGSILLLASAGVPVPELIRAAGRVKPEAQRRFQVFRKKQNNREILLIDDSYNANEASFLAAIRSMREILPEGRLALFAGEMAELGNVSPSAHASVGNSAGEMAFAEVFASGTKDAQILLDGYRAHFKEGRTVLEIDPLKLLDGFTPDKFDGILVKGSRRARMDLVSDAIKKNGFVNQAESDV